MSENLAYRKFYKVSGVHSVFNLKNETGVYDTRKLKSESDLASIGITNINKNTILFITADKDDANKKIEINVNTTDEYGENGIEITERTLSEFDTMIWVKNEMYALSQKCVKHIEYDNDAKKYRIEYSDGEISYLSLTVLENNYQGLFPLVVDNNSEIRRIYFYGNDKADTKKNFIINFWEDELEKNENSSEYVTIMGKGNKTNTKGQIILGNYNEVDPKAKFIISEGTSNTKRLNLATVNKNGEVFALQDFILKKSVGDGNNNTITHRLSDIHNVIDDDWYRDQNIDNSFSGDFSNQYN